MNNREWCYVQFPLSGTKKWDFCKPNLDYDKLRSETQKAQKLISEDLIKINPEIIKNIKPANLSFDKLKKISKSQDELMKKTADIFDNLENINKRLSKLYNTKNSLDNQEKLTKDLKFQIEQKLYKIKEDEEKELESIINPTELYKKEETHDTIFTNKKSNTKKCKGLILYEDEEEGDGLIGFYFDNESWLGNPIERKDSEINFDWTATTPIKNFNPNNFSTIWKGFLSVPFTDYYIFTIEADDGVELIINREKIIIYKMNNSIDDNVEQIGLVSEINDNIISSNKIKLNSGNKISIYLKYYHTVHDSMDEDQQAYVKLSWSSNVLKKKIISNKYLFSSNDLSPLKITGFLSEDASIRKLQNDDYAFKDSENYIIKDVPPQFLNMVTLKYNKKYLKDNLSFTINSPSIVYIGILNNYPYPLPDDFEITGFEISLLFFDKPGYKSSKKIISENSGTIKIYKKSFPIGKVEIKLKKKGINQFGIPLILFVGNDPRSLVPITCGGKEINLSSLNSPYFNECKASSEKENWNCEAGFNEKMRDEEGKMWASNNEGEGAWIQVFFKGLFEFTKFYYKDKKNPSERNSKLELLFSNGNIKTLNLKNRDDLVSFPLDSVRASSVKITIKSVYGSINNGGAFKFYGLPCLRESKSDIKYKLPGLTEFEDLREKIEKKNIHIHPIFDDKEIKIINLGCRDSLSNCNVFDDYDISEGAKFYIKCQETCASSKREIFGGNLYSKDSVICKAAYHSGKLSLNAGLVIMLIKKGISNYRGVKNEKRKVKSKSKAYSSISIEFEEYKEIDQIIFKNNSKVDFLEQNVWKKAIIKSFTSEKNNEYNLKLIIEDGENNNLLDIKYPTIKIKPCGTHTKNRVCEGSLKNIKHSEKIKIRFVPENYPNGGDFLPDTGDIYGLNGKNYGWSRSMKDNIIINNGAKMAELETYIIWPPSIISRFCNKPNPDIVCEPVSYALWVGKGKFKVKLFIGDIKHDIIAYFTINSKEVLKAEKILKNDLKIFETEIDSLNEFLIITSECFENCDNIQSKLNALEIKLIKSDDESKNKNKEVKLDCGESYTGGRCEEGPDVLHCLFENKFDQSVKFCTGENSLMKLPDDYKCKSQKNNYKCVRLQYGTVEDCIRFCPKLCQLNQCLY